MHLLLLVLMLVLMLMRLISMMSMMTVGSNHFQSRDEWHITRGRAGPGDGFSSQASF
jgi:hypothetical protein